MKLRAASCEQEGRGVPSAGYPVLRTPAKPAYVSNNTMSVPSLEAIATTAA